MVFESIVLGIIQGVAEWLPVSSEGLLVLVQTNFFGGGSIVSSIQTALFLHLGTFLAAFIYFRKDILNIIKKILQKNSGPTVEKKVFWFLVFSTFVSAALGAVLLKSLEYAEKNLYIESIAKGATLFIGILLLITAYLQIRAKKVGMRTENDIKNSDSVILGITQGFSALPGLSRSGLTVSILLLRKFDETSALKLSFLMSLPIVLAGNIVLNLNKFTVDKNMAVGFLFSFLFGYATIHMLLKAAKKINFGYFVLLFGIVTILSAFL